MISRLTEQLHGLTQCACHHLQGENLRDFCAEANSVADSLNAAQDENVKKDWAAAGVACRDAQRDVTQILAEVEIRGFYTKQGNGKGGWASTLRKTGFTLWGGLRKGPEKTSFS